MERPNLAQIPLQQDIYSQIDVTDSTMKIHITGPEEDKFKESITTLLSGQQDLQKQSLDMIRNMTR